MIQAANVIAGFSRPRAGPTCWVAISFRPIGTGRGKRPNYPDPDNIGKVSALSRRPVSAPDRWRLGQGNAVIDIQRLLDRSKSMIIHHAIALKQHGSHPPVLRGRFFWR